MKMQGQERLLDNVSQGPNLNPGMTPKATWPMKVPGLFQDRHHSLADHLPPFSFQDEADSAFILKREWDEEFPGGSAG